MKYAVLRNVTLKFNLTLNIPNLKTYFKTLRFCNVPSPLVTVKSLGIIFGTNPNIFTWNPWSFIQSQFSLRLIPQTQSNPIYSQVLQQQPKTSVSNRQNMYDEVN